LDVSNEAGRKDVTDTTVNRYGQLNILVNCAGVFLVSSIAELTLAKWHWVMSINVDGVFLWFRKAAASIPRVRTGGKYGIGE
jgi:NAD(P)-dependent dehydrogenase (short-subunit alcohol dehydrogenase family)